MYECMYVFVSNVAYVCIAEHIENVLREVQLPVAILQHDQNLFLSRN